MRTITLVTGNPHKLAELRQIFPASLNLTSQKLELDEIQSLDLHEIVRHKLHQAYEQVKGPVIVEDVSAEVEELQGLPGPFVKFFEQTLGRGALHKIAGDSRVRIICAMGYYDGHDERIVDGIMEGRLVAPDLDPQSEGFGFDFEIIPDGYDKTVSQLGMEVKNTISHRASAAAALAKFLT